MGASSRLTAPPILRQLRRRATRTSCPGPGARPMQLTQDCNDSCCGDHVGNDEYAWDWANGGGFDVRAARGGTVTHLKINSTTGCGTQRLRERRQLHRHRSRRRHAVDLPAPPGHARSPGVTLRRDRGSRASRSPRGHHRAGRRASTCTSRSARSTPARRPASAAPNGTTCAANTVPWSSFWVNATYPCQAIPFDEWPAASQCANRRITMPASQNQ